MASPQKKTPSALLLALSLTLLAWKVEGDGNGRGKKEVSGRGPVYLGQQTGSWRPLVQTIANITEARSIKSSFDFRTFDPEGTVFYGDTKNGADWFVFSLKGGIPMMQIKKGDILISVTGGQALNDGKWHLLELSNKGDFVILEVDGSKGLVVGLQSDETDEAISGELRLALGGILIDKEKLLIPYEPQMDGCVREGSWLNLTTPWETEEEELWPCYENIQPGSYFPGTGCAVFNTLVFPVAAEETEVKIEMWGEFSEMDGTILSFRSPGQVLVLAVVANKTAKDVTASCSKNKLHVMQNNFKGLTLIFAKDSIQLLINDGPSRIIHVTPEGQDSLTTWRDGRLAIGGLLGEGEDYVCSDYLTGCLDKVQVQGKDLDLDVAVKHASVSSYSCPA